MRVTVATYNVRSFRGGVEAAVEALEEPPDVVLVQECGRRGALRRFARLLGREVVSSHRPFGRVRNAVAYPPSWRLLDARSERLTRQGRTMPRGFIVARVRAGPVRLTLASAHLGLAPGERKRHARELTDALVGAGEAVVVGADLNEGPEGNAVRWTTGRLYDAFAQSGEGPGDTYPATMPTARIDYLLVGGGVTVERCSVPGGPAAASASDHRPAVAVLRVASDRG